MTYRMIPDQCHTKSYVKRHRQLASRIYHAALVGDAPQPQDLANALVFVGRYRNQHGYERDDCRLERACLSIETVLALFLGNWITHRDGIEQGCLQTLLSVRRTAA